MLKRCILGLVVLVGGVGVFFSQQDKDVLPLAQIFPKDAFVYLELNDFQDGFAKLKSYVQQAVGQKRYLELREDILESLEDLSEKAAKDILPALRSVKQVGFGVYKDGLALGIRSSSARLLQDILVAFKDELYGPEVIEGVKVYELEYYDGGSAYVSVLGSYILAASEKDLLKRLIRGYMGSDDEDSVQKHRNYAGTASGLRGEGFSLRGFWDIRGTIRGFRRTGQRSDLYEFDRASAIFGLDGFQSLILRMQLGKDNLARWHHSLHIEPDTAIYQLIRQRPARKETLRFIPEGALGAIALTLNDPKQSWGKIKRFIDDNADYFSIDMEDWLEGLDEELGIRMDQIVGVLGDEIGLIMDSPTIFHFQRPNAWIATLSFVAKLKDKDRAKEILEKLSEVLAEDLDKKFKEKVCQGVKIKYIKVEKGIHFAYAFVDSHLVIGFSLSMVRDIIKAYKGKTSMADKKAFQDALSHIPDENTLLVITDLKKLYNFFSLILGFSQMRLPKLAKDFGDLYTVTAWVTGNKSMEFDSCGMVESFSSLLLMAIGIPFLMGWRIGIVREFPDLPEIEKQKRVKPFKLPDDPEEAKRLISSLIEDLRSKEKRNQAFKKLKGAGRDVIPHVKPLLSSSDLVIRRLAEEILLYVGAFDAVPDAVKRYIEECMDLLDDDRLVWTYSINGLLSFKPNERLWKHILKDRHFRVLKSEVGKQKWAEALASDELSEESQKNGAWHVYNKKIGIPAGPLLKVLKNRDEEDRLLQMLTLALGYCEGKGVDEYLVSKLADDDLSQEELGCVHTAIEVRKDRNRFIPELISRLKSEEEFIRFNAGLTLFRLVQEDLPAFNAFEDEKKRAEKIKLWEQWWREQKEGGMRRKR
jgi:hypothetical protein